MQSQQPHHQQQLYDQGYDAGFNGEGEEEDAYYGKSYFKDVVRVSL